MKKKNEEYILMYKDYEVLSFEVDYEKEITNPINKLKDFDKAPYGIKDLDNEGMKNLRHFFDTRMIPSSRTGYEKILKYTKCKSGFELSFKGHGLSCSNHYWYKKPNEKLLYKDINFFENKWDDSFGRAIINNDYEALEKADKNVPDVVTAGWAIKGWIYENGPKLYKLGIDANHYEECLGEVLASKLAKRLFTSNEVTNYELKKIKNGYASCCPSNISIDEDLIPLSSALPMSLNMFYRTVGSNKTLLKEFMNRLLEQGYKDIYLAFVKLRVLRSLGFVSDIHFDNISIIKNIKTGETRVAPLYDLAGAFGSSESGRKIISNVNQATFLIIYFLFNDLDPKWDYSWYDPNKLDGFEDEIREILSLGEFYTPYIIENVISVYQNQKKSLDEIVFKK